MDALDVHHTEQRVRGIVRFLDRLAESGLKVFKERPEVPSFKGHATIAGSALDLLQTFFQAGDIEQGEGGGVFDIGDLSVTFAQQHAIDARAFRVVGFPGVISRLILFYRLKHDAHA